MGIRKPFDLSRRHILGGAAALIGLAAGRPSRAAARKQPVAPVRWVEDEYWGVKVRDPYRWMEAKPDTEEFKGYLRQQAGYTRAWLDRQPGRDRLSRAIATYSADMAQGALLQASSAGLLMSFRDAGEPAAKLVLVQPGGARKVLFDPAAAGRDGQPAGLSDARISPDGRWLAYVIDHGGDEMRELYYRPLDGGEAVLVSSQKASLSQWLLDSSGLLYSRLRDGAVAGTTEYYFGMKVYRHLVGTDPSADTVVVDVAEGPPMGQSERDWPDLVLRASSPWALTLFYANGDQPASGMTAPAASVATGKTPWQAVFDASDEVAAAVPHGDYIYVLARGGSPRGRVFRVRADAPGRADRETVVPEGAYAIDTMALAKDGLYIHEWHGSVGALKRYGFDSGTVDYVPLPRSGAVWSVTANEDQPGVHFGMDGLTWPGIYLHCAPDLSVTETHLVPPPPYDVSPFRTEFIEVVARDGVAVPVEICRRADLVRDGMRPVLVTAYGAYGVVLDPGFVAQTLAFLDAGGIVVNAHVRGGGEKGEDWHKAGMKATKPNTWRDAIDVSEHMIHEGWTTPRHLAIWGTSAGGIMVGRAITERPDLFCAAICDVGLFDALRFELTQNGPGNDLEFGTVKKEDEFHALLEMDSLRHVTDGTAYPGVLAITGANDPRVEPWEVAKFHARLQSATTSGRPVLLRVDYGSGHGAGTKALSNLKYLDMFVFILSQQGAPA